MEVLGSLLMVLVGVTLGVIGGGGSILTVPILVYAFKLPADVATSYSLFLVGVVSAVGALQYARQGMVAFQTGLAFALPGFLGVFLVRRFLVPAVPSSMNFFDAAISKDQLILGVFALVMLLASVSMIKGRKEKENAQPSLPSRSKLFLVAGEGLLVGGITGFVGAGGGFLIIPALVMLARLPMKQAVATSLMIIAFKSLFGFLGDLGVMPIDWLFLLYITLISVFGIGLGFKVARFFKGEQLKPIFGYFVLLMAVFIFIQQVV